MKKQKKQYKVPPRIMAVFTGALILLMVMVAFSKPQSGSAAPGDLSSAVATYPILNTTSMRLQTCTLCHTTAPSTNPYGLAYKNAGRNPAAFAAIANFDSDGDGFTNLQEINAGTFPGDPADHPVVPTKTPLPAPTNTPIPAATNTPIPATTNTPVPGVPSATSTPASNSTSATIGLAPVSVTVGGSSTATVSLNNVPAGGFASAEFTCTYNPTLVEVTNITAGTLFGADPVTAINGPQNGSFIVAIAGSKGNKATTGGAVFTFSAKGLQIGQSAINCQVRASTGNLVLTTIPSTPVNLVVASSQGTFAGQVLASKPVTITLYNPDSSIAGSVNANADGTFTLPISAGTFTAVASAPGFLKGQGSANITSGSTTTFQVLNLSAGDIDGNNVIDQFDALTIGINYNGTAPAAADLNNDGTINVLDLETLARSYRQTGPLTWQ